MFSNVTVKYCGIVVKILMLNYCKNCQTYFQLFMLKKLNYYYYCVINTGINRGISV